MKILSPAGNFESLKAAVFNGADEVYLGINDFNARNNIDGFSSSDLKTAVDFAHIFDVKVNLAINILFSNEEIETALDTIVDAYNLGVDCFIVQDIGLAKLVHDNYPEIELHASTQMGLHNIEGVKAVEQFGFKRVVLARETPLEEIERIKQNTNLEVEYFAQGALCVSFSGNCYLSSYLCDASGNRGRCKQLCRLPYSFEKNGKTIKSGYLLSAKDFNMTSKLQDLKSAGVDVLKIEGRARRPFYVAVTTSEYCNALNKTKVNQENLKLAFNRNFTPGYFDGNGNIISNYQNHIGVFVGTIDKVSYGKKFNEVYFSSNRELSPKSTFKIFCNNKEKTTLTAYDLKELSKGKYKLTTTQKVSVGYKVHLIVDSKLEDEILSVIKKRQVLIRLFAQENKQIKAIIEIDSKCLEVYGDVCQKANNQPLSIKNFSNTFSKSEFFDVKLQICKLDNIFMPKQKLNEFRRTVFAKVYDELVEKHRHNLNKTKVATNYEVIKFENFQFVETIKDDFVAENIIYSPSFYAVEDVKAFQEKCKKHNKTAFLDTPNFALEKDIALLKQIINETKIGIVANNYYALTFDTNIVVGAGLNVYNSIAAQFYNKPIITAESNISTKINFPYMTLRHCPFKSHLRANCNNCPYCDGYAYKMENGKTLKIKRKKLDSCTFYLVD